MNWHDPKTALLLGAILGLALWTPALPWRGAPNAPNEIPENNV
jgi:hypothetical protein